MLISDWTSDVCSSDLLVLFGAYTTDLERFAGALGIGAVDFSLSNPYIIVGLLLGALLPFSFGAFGMTAVGRAAGSVVEDVRAQFRDNPGIMAGTSKPNYARTVDLVTKAAIKEMILPSRSEEHTSELQSLMRISYAVFCLK